MILCGLKSLRGAIFFSSMIPAEYADVSLGELLEDIILHSFEGPNASAFAKDDFRVIADLKKVYGMNYDVHSNYRFVEKNAAHADN